jgi:hypothetical protein
MCRVAAGAGGRVAYRHPASRPLSATGARVRLMVIRGRERRGWLGIVLGAPNARQLAYFYRDLLGWELATDEPDWCTIGMPDAPVNLGFQTE